MRDQDLVRLLQKDPDSGLQATLRGYGPLIKAVLVRILPRDPRDVEECMADVLVALRRCAGQLERQKTPLRPWLIVTARNCGIDRYHSLRRHAALSLDAELGQTLGELAEFGPRGLRRRRSGRRAGGGHGPAGPGDLPAEILPAGNEQRDRRRARYERRRGEYTAEPRPRAAAPPAATERSRQPCVTIVMTRHYCTNWTG